MFSRVDKVMTFAFPILLILLGLFYYFVDPNTQYFLIQCPWRLCTGTLCPACGFQRALYALAHGNAIKALSYNYFFVLSIPYAVAVVLVSWYNFGHRLDCLKRIVFHPITLKAYVVLFCTWWIARNLLHL